MQMAEVGEQTDLGRDRRHGCVVHLEGVQPRKFPDMCWEGTELWIIIDVPDDTHFVKTRDSTQTNMRETANYRFLLEESSMNCSTDRGLSGSSGCQWSWGVLSDYCRQDSNKSQKKLM